MKIKFLGKRMNKILKFNIILILLLSYLSPVSVPKVSGRGNYYAPTCLVEIYDTLTDSWETGLPLPVASGLVGAVTVERKIYALVGETSQFFVFDVDQNKWTELARIPVDANTGSFGMVALEGKIYVVRGSGNYPSGIYWTYCYDPQTNSWTEKSPIPYHRTIESLAELNGKLYAIGGSDPSLGGRIETSRVDMYDPTTDTWTLNAISSMSKPRTHLEPETPVLDGKIYVIGGWDGYSTLSAVERFDPSTNSWETLTPMPTARYGFATAVVSGKIYCIGGDSGGAGGNPKTANEVFDGSSWVSKKSMPTARSNLAAAAVDNKIYAIGGFIMHSLNQCSQIFEKINETYTYYYKYAFNGSWYKEKAEEIVEDAWKSLFELTYEPAVETLLLELIPDILQSFATSIDIASTTYDLLTSYSSFLTVLKCTAISGHMRYYYYDEAYSALSSLLSNTRELIEYAKNGDADKVRQLLNDRKVLIENLYTKLKNYNDALVDSIKMLPDLAALYAQYPALRYIIDSLRSVLKTDYEVVTYYLNGSPKRLSEYVNAPLGEVTLEIEGYKTWALNTFESIGENRIYEISVSEDEAKEDWWGLLKPRLNIELLVPSKVEFEVYLKYNVQPTRDSYDQKQSNSGKSSINLKIEPKAGKYYVMVTSPKGFGGYTIRVSAFKSICLFVWCSCPVNILVKDPFGRRVGFDVSTNATVKEIEGANYSGPYSSPQIITIPDPYVGNYSVYVYGWDNGSYTLKITSTTSNETIIESISLEGQIASQEEKIFDFKLDIKSQLIQKSIVAEYVSREFYAGNWYGKNYYVHILSNSSVTDFVFNETERLIRFRASGQSETSGMCIVSIPKELMWGNFLLYIDRTPLTEGVDYTANHNATHYNFLLYYPHSWREIEIRSEYAVQEFLSPLILTIFMLTTLIATTIWKIKSKHQRS